MESLPADDVHARRYLGNTLGGQGFHRESGLDRDLLILLWIAPERQFLLDKQEKFEALCLQQVLEEVLEPATNVRKM